MSLINLNSIHLSFGNPALLESISFSIEKGERVCLIGRNGEGKSTLMKVIAGEVPADDGTMIVQQGAKISMMSQEMPQSFTGSVFDLVADGLGGQAGLIKDYHDAINLVGIDPSEKNLDKLAKAQHELEAVDGWQLEQRVEEVISRIGLDPDADISGFSGGMKRRVLLAKALVCQPDLLLLDEPTNHLDIESIDWIEKMLLDWNTSLLFITHDRRFLRRLATRIISLERGLASDWPGDYDNYLRRREEVAHAEELENARFDKKLAQEEVWIRQGIKARRTRNEGRVRALEEMREKLSDRRSKQGSAKLEINEGERAGKIFCEIDDISFKYDGKDIVKNFSSIIQRGDRVAIVGPNGCGKSTLLKLILGQLEPDSGEVKSGSKNEIAYFDQLRDQLDLEKTVWDNVAEGSDSVTINGQPKHVIGYLQDFLFAPARARQPVKSLSGGERNRLLLAKLFTKPANVLVLDEPTNDLDVETLELLEELLMNFDGTLLVVSHDRQFLDNVVTSTFVFEENGVNNYVGGFSDWENYKKSQIKEISQATAKKVASAKSKKTSVKLTYKDQKELDELPAAVEQFEQRLVDIETELSDPEMFTNDSEKMQKLADEMAGINEKLAVAYDRWQELEA